SRFKQGVLLVLEWSCAFVIFVVACFAPLLSRGLVYDLVRGLSVAAYGGPYSHATPAQSARFFLEQVREPKTAVLLMALVLLALRSSSRTLKTMTRTWLLAVMGALLYRPLHPVDHGYLRTPLALINAIAWSIPMTWGIGAAIGERRISY